MTPWIAVDLDGTLAFYDTWKDGEIGKPIPKMVEFVKKLIEDGNEVRIFTARVAIAPSAFSDESKSFADEDFAKKQEELIRKWCLENIGKELPVTATKDFEMIMMYDDRCVQVEMNTGRLVK